MFELRAEIKFGVNLHAYAPLYVLSALSYGGRILFMLIWPNVTMYSVFGIWTER